MSERFAMHLQAPQGCGHTPKEAHTGAAGGAACGDLIRVSLSIDEHDLAGTVLDVGFDASGCGAVIAAGSATVSLVRGLGLLDAARLGPDQIAAELGGLIASKRHAAELAADALHRALGAAARRGRLAQRPDMALVAMSGGVDSAVAALMTIGQGGEAAAVTLELWADPENDGRRSCCSAESVRLARGLAHRLGLAHFSLDLRPEFKAGVVEPWLADHAAGLTPYPCVRCNGSVRLDGMLGFATQLGAQRLVTGHYARIAWDQDGDGPLLRRALDDAKDQSYALASLGRDSLARMSFPLGDLRKEQVRELAAEAELSVARRPDSQDLCFLAGTTQRRFLARHGGGGYRQGPILDGDGGVLGWHEGAEGFTIGQRHGLGLGGGQPRYVLATDAHRKTVTVGPREDLLTSQIEVRDALLQRDGDCVDTVKIRYRGRRLSCQVLQAATNGAERLDQPAPGAGEHPRLLLRFPEPVERTAPGQLACLYSGDLLVGHGTIARSAHV